MSPNTRRRLALYGSAAAIALGVWAATLAVRRQAPRIEILDVGEARKAESNEATVLLRELIRIDTSNPPGRTREAIDAVARAFACEGIPYEIVGESDRPNLVARLRGSQRGDALLLLNHIDVVPPGDLEAWDAPPFGGEVGQKADARYLYGRGTLDMKGQLVAGLFAMASLARDGIVPDHDVVFVAESGEETFTPEIGVGWVLENRPDLLEGVTDVFNEGGVNEVITSEIRRFGIEVLQKATVAITVEGGSRKELEDFTAFLLEHNKGEPYRLVPAVKDFMAFIGPSRNDIWGRSMIHPEDALSAPWFRQWAPEIYKWLVQDYVFPGAVTARPGGGFEMEVAATLLPGASTREWLKRLDGWIAERGLTRRIRFVTPESIPTPQSGRGWDALTTAFSLDPVRADVGIYVLTVSYTNSAYLRARGYRTYGITPFNVNINDAAKIHHVNERIVLPYFVEGVERMKRIVREYATAP